MAAERDTLRVLVVAYACEPGRGSEPGAGWGLVNAASSFAACTVLTGPEHISALETWSAEHPEVRLDVVEVPEPSWSRLFERGRLLRFLIYIAWLRRARRVAIGLAAEGRFDAAWHVTYSTYWLSSPAVDLNLPSVWGPVGGAVTTPLRLWRFLGPIGILIELVDFLAVRVLALAPATRRTARKATVPIVQNETTRHQLPTRAAEKAAVLNHALFTESSARRGMGGDFLLWVGPLESRKGPRLAVKALAHTPTQVRLVVAGDGPELRPLERLATRLGVRDRVELLGQVTRSKVMELLESCAAAVFTGLREEGGIALAEAMYAGVPVIVLAHGGAATIAMSSVDPDRVALVQPNDPAETVRQLADAMARFVLQPPAGGGPLLDRIAAVAQLEDLFASAVRSHRPGAAAR